MRIPFDELLGELRRVLLELGFREDRATLCARLFAECPCKLTSEALPGLGRSVIAMLIVVASGCASEPTVSPSGVEDDTTVIPTTAPKEWESPRRIHAAPLVDSHIGTIPLAFGSVGADLYLLINIPQDTVLPHVKNRLGVLSFDGASWELLTHLAGSGRNWPAAISPGVDGVHLFWAGHSEDEQRDFEQGRVKTTHLYHCLLTGEVCRNTSSVPASQGTGLITNLFGTPVLDQRGRAQVVPFSAFGKHLVYAADGQLVAENNDVMFDTYPNLARDGPDVVQALMGGQLPTGSTRNNWIQIRRFDGANWGSWIPVYQPPDKWDPIYPRIAIDSEGAYHVISYLWHDSGRIRLIHLRSWDRGRLVRAGEALRDTILLFPRPASHHRI